MIIGEKSLKHNWQKNFVATEGFFVWKKCFEIIKSFIEFFQYIQWYSANILLKSESKVFDMNAILHIAKNSIQFHENHMKFLKP